MKKEEIMEKNKADNQNGDERESQIMSKASNIGLVVGLIVLVFMAILSEIVDEPSLALSALAVNLLMLGSRDLYRYVFIKNKIDLVMALLSIIAGFADFIAMIIFVLKK